MVSAWTVCRWCCCNLTAVNAEPVLSQEWHYSKQITITVSLSYLIQHSPSHTHTMNSNAGTHTHTHLAVLICCQRTQRRVTWCQYLKEDSATGTSTIASLIWGPALIRLSWNREILLKERRGVNTHMQTTHARTQYPLTCRELLKYTRKLIYQQGLRQHVAPCENERRKH